MTSFECALITNYLSSSISFRQEGNDDSDDDTDNEDGEYVGKTKTNSITHPNPETAVAKSMEIGLTSYSHEVTQKLFQELFYRKLCFIFFYFYFI